MPPDPQATYDLLRKEAAAYSKELAAKPHIVVLTKSDLRTTHDARRTMHDGERTTHPSLRSGQADARRTTIRTDAPVVEISAITRQGIPELLEQLWKILKS